MVPVISEQKWSQWCDEKQLPVNSSRFALDTCYFGLGFRTRPGTIVITDTEVIHESYSWRDSRWAMFEPSVRISISLSQVREVLPLRLGVVANLLHAMPQSVFRIIDIDGHHHDFLLQRHTNEFIEALRSLGVLVLDLVSNRRDSQIK